MMTANRRFLWLATAVLLFAAVFRLAALHDVPPGLSQDEVLNADVVSFIRGGYHALFFREGYGHEPLYHYWSVPFQALLGDNVLSIRLPAVVLGLLLVALALRWAKREFGTVTAVVTGFLLAVSWWPVIFSRIGIRPILEPVLLLIMAWFWPKRPFLAGLFLGLSIYSYTGARVMLALPLLWAGYEGIVFLWDRWRDRGEEAQKASKERLRNSLWQAVKMGGVALLVAAPLFYVLQADPTLQQRVDQLSGPLDALRAGDFGPIWQNTLQTMGVFSFTGDPRWTYTLPERPLFDWVTAVLFYTGLLLAVWRIKQPQYAFLLLWLFIALIPSAVTPQSPSTIRLIGALPVVYVLPGLAVGFVDNLFFRGSRPLNLKHKLLIAAFLLILILNMGRTFYDGFLRWPQAEETRLNHYQTVLLDMSRYYRGGPVVVADGFYEPIDRDSFRRNLGAFPAARWVQTGATVAGAIVIPKPNGDAASYFYVPEFAAPHPDLMAAAGIVYEPVYRSLSNPSFAVYNLPTHFQITPWDKSVSFAERISLTGYESLPVGADNHLTIFTTWQVVQTLPTDLAIFVHLVDAQGNLLSQYDGLDAAPATLTAGDSFIQRHILALPESGLPSGAVLRVGLYQRNEGSRWQPVGQANDFYTIPISSFDEKGVGR